MNKQKGNDQGRDQEKEIEKIEKNFFKMLKNELFSYKKVGNGIMIYKKSDEEENKLFYLKIGFSYALSEYSLTLLETGDGYEIVKFVKRVI